MKEIPRFVSKFESGIIPEKVARNPQEDKESKPFLISFERYNNHVCEILHIYNSSNKKIVINLKQIGQLFSIDDLHSQNIISKPVEKAGDYKKLFNGLDLQTKLKEIILSGTDRMFYFTIINRFYIVAITHTHLETKKNRK